MSISGFITPPSSQDQFHVILVEPEESLNVGSVARAMANLGFKHLHLVRPVNYDPERAAVTACWGEALLQNVQLHDSLESAIGPMTEVVGFSTREGKNRSARLVLDDWLAGEISDPPAKTALVFGPEDNGLRQEHTDLCRCVVRIPSTRECPSFNLAHSVLLVAFELSKRTWQDSLHKGKRKLPNWNEFSQLDRIVTSVLERSGYYQEGTPASVPGLVKALVRRMNPDAKEMGVLLGLFSRLEKTLLKTG